VTENVILCVTLQVAISIMVTVAQHHILLLPDAQARAHQVGEGIMSVTLFATTLLAVTTMEIALPLVQVLVLQAGAEIENVTLFATLQVAISIMVTVAQLPIQQLLLAQVLVHQVGEETMNATLFATTPHATLTTATAVAQVLVLQVGEVTENVILCVTLQVATLTTAIVAQHHILLHHLVQVLVHQVGVVTENATLFATLQVAILTMVIALAIVLRLLQQIVVDTVAHLEALGHVVPLPEAVHAAALDSAPTSIAAVLLQVQSCVELR